MTVSLTLDKKLSREVTLHLVNDAALKPAEVTLFNHPDSYVTLNITGGRSMGSYSTVAPSTLTAIVCNITDLYRDTVLQHDYKGLYILLASTPVH